MTLLSPYFFLIFSEGTFIWNVKNATWFRSCFKSIYTVIIMQNAIDSIIYDIVKVRELSAKWGELSIYLRG